MHEGFLVYAGFRYLKIATLLCVAAIAVYAWHAPPDEPNGGTWLGYGLGCIGAALILWLMWFGVRKRRYGTVTKLQGWLSAHVYLGLSLIIVALIAAAGVIGWGQAQYAAEGPLEDHPAANFYRVAAKPEQMASSVSQIFLGVRIECAQCHHHPFDRWTQDDYYGWSAVFSRIRTSAAAAQTAR